MATAVSETAPAAKATDPGDRLLPASILAAVFLLAGLVAVGYGIPRLFLSVLPGSTLAVSFLRVIAQVVALAALVFLSGKLAGANPPRGLRGGTFIVLATLLLAFFLWRAISLGVAASSMAAPITIALGVGLVFGAFRFLTSPRARGGMTGMEDMGWFHTFSYKRTQGLKMRRYTIVGILLIGLSGVWTLISHDTLGHGDLLLRIPFLDHPFAVLADKNYTVPLLLAAIILWIAWRAVNMPVFADFLIATEAEMNKVSWSTRRRLMQDTVVVLVTTLILTVFLLAIDLFWGWLLSLSFVGVLPNKDELNHLKKAESPTKQMPWEGEAPPGK